MQRNNLTHTLRSRVGLRSHRAVRVRSAYSVGKRMFDIAITVMLAPLALLIVGILALAIRISGEKAFYCQPRVGKDGRIFKLWKLRTMVHDAEQRLRDHLAADPEALVEWTVTQKLQNDPRITRLGKYLRKYSLDELPQLLNVFMGEMSLVGPRPILPEQRQGYPGKAYFELRPGLTGLWQVSGRNACTFAERAQIDTLYSRMMSFSTDLGILFRTPLVVLRGTGV